MDLKVAEATMRFEVRAVLRPVCGREVQGGNFPARLATHLLKGIGARIARHARARNKPELLVLLPVIIGGEFSEALEALLALAQRRFGTRLFCNVVRHASHDRRRNALGAQRVGVFPESIFAGPGLHQHQPAGHAVLLEPADVIVELRPSFGREDIANVHVQQLRQLVAQDFRGPRVDRADAPVQLVRADQVLAVLHEVAVAILAFLQRGMRPATLERGREQVGRRLQELSFALLEAARRPGVHAEHAPGTFRAWDYDAHAAHHAMLHQKRRAGKPLFLRQVGHDYGCEARTGSSLRKLVLANRVARLRVEAGADNGVSHRARLPAHAGCEPQPGAIWQQLQHLRELDAERLRDNLHRAVEQRVRVRLAQPEQPELDQRPVAILSRAQFVLDAAALGDVAPGTAVPGEASDGVEHRLAAQGLEAFRAVDRDAHILEVAERQPRLEHGAVRVPAHAERRRAGELPAAPAENLLPRHARFEEESLRHGTEAQLRVLLPIPIRGQV